MAEDGAKMSSEVAWELRGPDGELKASGGNLPKDTKDEETPR